MLFSPLSMSWLAEVNKFQNKPKCFLFKFQELELYAFHDSMVKQNSSQR